MEAGCDDALFRGGEGAWLDTRRLVSAFHAGPANLILQYSLQLVACLLACRIDSGLLCIARCQQFALQAAYCHI